MSDNYTSHAEQSSAHPFAAQLTKHGVPATMWPALHGHGVGTLVEKLDIHFTEFSVERVSATMPVAGNTQVVGILHGGASAALAETLGSMAAALHGAGKANPVGVDLNITHHKAGRAGLVTGVCTPIHLGRRITTHEIIISNDEGHRVATARITNMLLPIES
ncbi:MULTISPECIES: hotdog fold thioesterase [Glutamicibacter]|nr:MULTISPECIES: hotdog fold thioesterase [Glutamicibacter]PCC37374.1 thioesterase [Glutamicibacter sp. BW77]HBV10869.1 hotdog fold thioesterase [Micrococcaceae bacterium]